MTRAAAVVVSQLVVSSDWCRKHVLADVNAAAANMYGHDTPRNEMQSCQHAQAYLSG